MIQFIESEKKAFKGCEVVEIMLTIHKAETAIGFWSMEIKDK